MRGIVQLIEGDPSSLVVSNDIEIPQPGPYDIVIRVQYAALNRMDILQSRGNYHLPEGASKILGVEVSGTVSVLGDDCERGFKYGDSVCALLLGGGYAEFCVAHEKHIIRAFPGISMSIMASIPEAFMTAYQLCFYVGSIEPGESVLVHAAASSVGQAIIQMLSQRGAIVYATVRSEAKRDICIELGAKEVFVIPPDGVIEFASLVKDANDGNLVDVVLDPVGVSYLDENINVLAMDGRWVLYGFMGGSTLNDSTLLSRLMAKRICLLPTTLRSRSVEYKEDLIMALESDEVSGFEAVKNGDIRVIVDKVFPMEEVLKAHQYMNSNQNVGKTLLSITSTSNVIEEFQNEMRNMLQRNNIINDKK